MASFQQTIIAGNLGADPESRFMPSGDAVCNFRVAVTEKWKKDGADQERTTWYRVVAYKKLAEICAQYLKKGSGVLIVGKMRQREWEKDGEKKSAWELEADTMQMLGGRSDGQQSAPRNDPPAERPQRQAQPSSRPSSFDDDDIPF